MLIGSLLVRLREALASQTRLARHDGLTGLLNARAFREVREEHFHLSRRHARALALCCIDLDGFKGVNDTLGQGDGDRVHQAVADTLQQRLRRHDLSARLGGEEFAVLMPKRDLDGARTACAALCAHLNVRTARKGWPIGFSLGVVVCDPPIVSAEDAMRRADALMYEVKRAGKNGLRVEAVAAAETGLPAGGLAIDRPPRGRR